MFHSAILDSNDINQGFFMRCKKSFSLSIFIFIRRMQIYTICCKQMSVYILISGTVGVVVGMAIVILLIYL